LPWENLFTLASSDSFCNFDLRAGTGGEAEAGDDCVVWFEEGGEGEMEEVAMSPGRKERLRERRWDSSAALEGEAEERVEGRRRTVILVVGWGEGGEVRLGWRFLARRRRGRGCFVGIDICDEWLFEGR
jgi:hypothetical protein